jgi:Prophage CP4-57 regulatory protein (AlpA)
MANKHKLITFDRLWPDFGINYTRDHLRRKVKAREFPTPVQVSDCRIAWLEREILQWIDDRIAAREGVIARAGPLRGRGSRPRQKAASPEEDIDYGKERQLRPAPRRDQIPPRRRRFESGRR